MKPIILVSPESINFKDLDIGDSDSIDVSVTNISRKSIHVRFLVSNPLFILADGPDLYVSPGITVSKEVSYIAEDLSIEKATLTILSEDCHKEIQIVAYPPLPFITSDVKKVNFGNVTITSNHSKKITLFNYGSAPGAFELIPSSNNLIISPISGVIEQNNKKNINISLKPHKPGKYTSYIHVKCDRTLSTLDDFEIKATVIDQSITVLDNGKEVSQIDFGHAFYGQKISKKVTFKNKGPTKREFTINVTHISGANSDPIFSTNEEVFNIEGNEQKEIEIFYMPPVKQEISLEDTEIKRFIVINTKNTSTNNEVVFFGTASSMVTNIYPIEFDFGVRSIKERVAKKLFIENNSKHQIRYKINERANYLFSPAMSTIKPNELKEITVCFKPNALGKFNTFANLEICGDLLKKKINLSAEAVVDTSGKPFRRQEIWETNTEAKLKMKFPDNPFCMTQRDVDEKRSKQKTFHKYITDSADMRAKRDQKIKLERRAKKIAEMELGEDADRESAIKDISTIKMHEFKKREEEIDFGIKFGEGLTPPEPKLRSFRAKLNGKLERDGCLTTRRQKKTKTRKLKQKPTTKLEITETSRSLTPHQLLSVLSSAETIDFGDVPVFSSDTKEFSIQNNLMQHIFVSFQIDDKELSKSSPTSQVIYPQQEGTFHITVEGLKIGLIEKSIRYTVNNQHEFTIMVRANIVPLDMKLSEHKLEFRFDSEQTESFITKTITLTNPTNVRAQVHWTGFNEVFSARPMMCFCPANGKTNFDITYRPSKDNHSEVKAVLNVLGGPSKYLKCVGYIGDPQLSINTDVVDFGIFPIGVSRTIEVLLQNKGEDAGLFNIYPNFTDILNISPPTGKLMPGEELPVTINIKSVKECNFDVPITISASGMNPIIFDVIGSAEAPHIDVIFNDDLDFGAAFTETKQTRHIVLSNPSIIPATIAFDLTGKEAFKIEYSHRLETRNTGRNSILLQSEKNSTNRMYQIYILPNTSVEFDLVFKPLKQADYSMLLPISSNNIKIASKKSLNVNANGLLPPIEVSSTWVDFGIATLTDPLNPNIRPTVRQVILTNKAKKDVKFKFDTSHIDPAFSIEPSEGVIKYASQQIVFILFRPTSGTLIDSFVPLYAITDNSLKYGSALKSNNETTKIVQVDGEEHFVCSKIQLTAVINTKKIKMSQNFVALPPVPLNIPVTRTIYVENIMFIEADLNIIVPVNDKMFPISLDFPEGTKLNHTTERLPIVITFISQKPMSFSTQIAVIDPAGSTCKFTVSALADNSVFSLHPFIKNNEVKVNIGKEGQVSVSLAKKADNNINDDFLSYVQSLTDIEDYKWNGETYNENNYEFIKYFLNAYCFTEKLEDIAADFRESCGDKLIDLISLLMGEKRPNSLANIAKLKCDTDEGKINKLKAILTCLIAQGCLLSHINPLFLTQKSLFISNLKVYTINLLLAENTNNMWKESRPDINKFICCDFFQRKLISRMEKYENLFEEISRASWLTVITQVLKVLYIGKFQIESFNKLPGVADALIATEKEKDNTDTESMISTMMSTMMSTMRSKGKILANYMSPIEMLLVKWVSIHVAKMNGEETLPKTLEDLKNSVFIGLLIKSHIPTIKLELNYNGSSLKPVCDEDYFENARNVANAISSLGIGLEIKPEVLLNGTPEIIALIVFQLLEALPHCIPSQTIEFESFLNGTVKKIVSIQNPSKQDISYHATIEGSENFSLEAEYLTIYPGQTFELGVIYSARTHNTETAKLSLIQTKQKVFEPKFSKESGTTNPRKRMRTIRKSKSSDKVNTVNVDTMQKEALPPSFASSIIINMVSSVKIGSPGDDIVIDGPLYGITKKVITIPNKCGIKGIFNLQSVILHTTDDSGNALISNKLVESKISNLFNKVEEEEKEGNEMSKMEQNLKNYKAFIFFDNKVLFSEESADIPVEFIPIEFGEYKCIALFSNESGEFLVEITGETSVSQCLETPITPFTCKTRALTPLDVKIPIETVNRSLVQAIAYSITKNNKEFSTMSDLKQQEILSMHVNEVTAAYLENVSSTVYSTVCSSEFYKIPEEIKFNIADGRTPFFPVKFVPAKPGTYNSKIILASNYDIRILNIVGTALAAEQAIDITLETISGKKVTQEIPFENNSPNKWIFEVNIEGDQEYFTLSDKLVARKFIVQPKSTFMFNLNFEAKKIGEYHTVITFTNLTKESIVNYHVKSIVSEPFAEEKLELEVHARDILDVKVDLPSFIKDGDVEVTSDLDILLFPEIIHFTNGKPDKKFKFNVSSHVSGKFVGTLTFTHKETGVFCWYIVEVNVTSPLPTDKFEIKAVQRETFIINIGMSNPKDHAIIFDVTKSDDDLIGDSQFVLDKESEGAYKILFTPFRSFERISQVTFINQEVGEFVFKLDITVSKPEAVTIAPMVANVGKSATTYINLTNNSDINTTFEVMNTNPDVFHVLDRNISIKAHRTKSIEIKYIPTSIGTNQEAKIVFSSPHTGEYVYKLCGQGKPPPPQSPLIVESPINTSNSGSVSFYNPFPFPMTFDVFLHSENPGAFTFLQKIKSFTLNYYLERQQVSFMFNSTNFGQFAGSIMISTHNSEGCIAWKYPLIGMTTVGLSKKIHTLSGKAKIPIHKEFEFYLPGESESFSMNSYKIDISYEEGFEWITKYLETRVQRVKEDESGYSIIMTIKFTPRKPLNTSITISVENELNQKWKFPIHAMVSEGDIDSTLTVESSINVENAIPVILKEQFTQRTEFSAYFKPGSSNDLHLSTHTGIIEQSIKESVPIPLEILFKPKVYGKLTKGVLVIETNESQFLISVIGRLPEYVPPVISKGSIDTHINKNTLKRAKQDRNRRSVIREHNDSVKIMKPKSLRRRMQAFEL